MFRFNKTIIREPTVCDSLKLQYWRQLKYFVVELLGRVTAFCSSPVGVCVSCTVLSVTVSFLQCARYTHYQDWITFKNRASYI
jgi:hypothetical protein